MHLAQAVVMTASGQVDARKCHLLGALLGTDFSTDVRFALHNGTSNADPKVWPLTTYDASAGGLNGALPPFMINCPDGIYLDVPAGAAYEIIVYFQAVGAQ